MQEYIATAQPVGRRTSPRARGQRLVGHRPQRDGRARAGGLPRPAPHVGRPDPHRQGLPVLRRPPRARRVRSTPRDASRCGAFFDSRPRPRSRRCCTDTTDLLADLTDYAAVVVGPPTEAATVRSVQLVGLSRRAPSGRGRARNGTVEKRDHRARRRRPTSDRRCRAPAHLAAAPRRAALWPPCSSVRADAATPPSTPCAPRRSTRCGTQRRRPRLRRRRVVDGRGLRRRRGRARRAAHARAAVRRRVAGARHRRSRMSVAIGIEHGVEPLSACSVVVAPVVVDGEHVGSVGVLGPTRMNYPQALATVDVVSERLGRRCGG